MMEYYISDGKFADALGMPLKDRALPLFYFGKHDTMKLTLASPLERGTRIRMICDLPPFDTTGPVFCSDAVVSEEFAESVSFAIDTNTLKFMESVSDTNSRVKAMVQVQVLHEDNSIGDIILDGYCWLKNVLYMADNEPIKVDDTLQRIHDDTYAASVAASDCAEEAKRSEIACKLMQESMENKIRSMT